MARSSARVRRVHHDSPNETRITTSLNQDHCHHRVEITSYGYEAIRRIKKKNTTVFKYTSGKGNYISSIYFCLHTCAIKKKKKKKLFKFCIWG